MSDWKEEPGVGRRGRGGQRGRGVGREQKREGGIGEWGSVGVSCTLTRRGAKDRRALSHWTGGRGMISLESFYVGAAGAEGPFWESHPAGWLAEAGPEGLAWPPRAF